MKAPRKSPNEYVYSSPYTATRSEIEYLRGLGGHRPGKAGNKLALIKSYLGTMHLRKDWGQIDPEAVRRAGVSMVADMVEVEPPKPFVPLDGHGLIGARKYAQRVAQTRTPIGYLDPEEDMA